MFFQSLSDIATLLPYIYAIVIILGGILIFKIGLAATKAESKTSFKWVLGSFFIQYGVTLFISAPMLLDMILVLTAGAGHNYSGPDPGILAMIVAFSLFVTVNFINMIHKPGIKRSIIIALLIIGPIVASAYIIFNTLGNVL